MSVQARQTNIAPGTSLYITREETAQFFSTLSGDLSGVNFSTFFLNPNPVVSSITCNPTGTISLPGAITTNSLGISSLTSLKPVSGFGGTNFNTTGFLNSAGSAWSVPYAGGWVATGGTPNVNNDKINLTNTGINAIPAATNTLNPFMTYLSGNPPASAFVLTNISSINGVAPNANATTFTSLTGSNITLTGMLTSPQQVSLSSINGLAYQQALTGTYIGSNNTGLASNAATSLLSITLPPGTLRPNTNYLYDVPVVIGNFPPSPINFQAVFGIRLGGNSQINYQTPYWIAANSVAPIPLNFTGVLQTNQTAVSAQTIELIGIQNAGSWACSAYNPTAGAGLNQWTLKILS